MLIKTAGYQRRHNIIIFQLQFSDMHNKIFTPFKTKPNQENQDNQETTLAGLNETI